MKFTLFKIPNLVEKERREKYCHWHDYFAWLPTHIGYENGRSKFAWLETIERRGSHCWDDYKNMPDWFDYREKGLSDENKKDC